METQNTLMGELLAVLKDSLRKQAFSVILLICACAALWLIRQDDRRDFQAQIVELKTQIADCSEARNTLSVTVATLTERLTVLERPHLR